MAQVTVQKYRSDEKLTVEVDDGECPACAALRKGGCESGVIFLECGGTLYRCYVTEWSMGGRGLVCVTCEVVSAEEVDGELEAL